LCIPHPVIAEVGCQTHWPFLADAFSLHTQLSDLRQAVCIALTTVSHYHYPPISAVLLVANPRLFFQPIEFHVQLVNFGIQPVLITLAIRLFWASLAFKNIPRVFQ
jgi:hypothetical protein